MGWNGRERSGPTATGADAAEASKLATPGKQTRTASADATSASTAQAVNDPVAAVAARVGDQCSDGGGYTYLVLPSTEFQIVTAPSPGKQGIKINRSRMPGAWNAVAQLLAKTPPTSRDTAAVPSPAAPSPAPQADTPAPAVPPQPSVAAPPNVPARSVIDEFAHELHATFDRFIGLLGGAPTPAPAPPPVPSGQ